MPTGTKARPKKSAAKKRPVKKRPVKKVLPRVVVEDLSDFNESINLLIYGDSGVGKTVLAGGAPDAVFISTEKGTIAAKRAGSKAKLIRATSWEALEAAIDYVETNPGKFKWAILDSLTKMQVLLIRYILKNIHEENESRDLDIPAIADHQKWQNMFKRFVDRLIDLDVNVIFTATAMHREDAEGDDLVLPDLQGKDYAISQYVCAQMDAVYAFVVKKKKGGERARNLIAQTTPPYFAKDRYDALGDFVTLGERDQDNMLRIIETIEESAEFEAIQKEGKKKARGKAKPDDDDEDDEDLDDSDDDVEDAEEPDDVDEDDDEEEDADDDEDDEDEPEKPSKAQSRRAQGKTPAKRSSARRKPPTAVEDDDEDDDDTDEEDEVPARKTGKAKTSRRPAKKAASPRKTGKTAKKSAKSAKADEEDFDPDDDAEVDFDDDDNED